MSDRLLLASAAEVVAAKAQIPRIVTMKFLMLSPFYPLHFSDYVHLPPKKFLPAYAISATQITTHFCHPHSRKIKSLLMIFKVCNAEAIIDNVGRGVFAKAG